MPTVTCLWRYVWAKLRHRESNVYMFLLVGVIGFIADSAAYGLASTFLPPSGARLCSIWLAIGVTWLLNRRFAFTPSAQKSLLVEYTHYLLSSLCGAAVNYVIFLCLLEGFDIAGMGEYIAIFISSAGAAAFNFLLYKYVVFEHPSKRSEPDDSCA